MDEKIDGVPGDTATQGVTCDVILYRFSLSGLVPKAIWDLICIQ